MPRPTHRYWEMHTTLVNIPHAGSGTREWQCKYCLGVFSSTLTRLIRHLSARGGGGIGGCKVVPNDVAQAVIRENPSLFPAVVHPQQQHGLDDDAVYAEGTEDIGTSHGRAEKRPHIDAPSRYAPSSSSGATGVSSSSPHLRSSSQPAITSTTFARDRQRLASIEIGRTVIQCNLSFHVLKTPQWRRMIRAVAAVGPTDSWEGPDYKQMRTTILDDEIARISSALDPIRRGWAKFGCTILSDGWTDIRRRHIINILVSSCLGTYFLRAVDAGTDGQSITGMFIYTHIRQAIMDVGVEHVVQVVTDNASNCRRMGEMLEDEFPTIVWTPCAAHCLDLMMEDIGKIDWISEVMADARLIVKFFRKKSKPLSIFRSYSELELVRPSMTRFAYMYLVLARLQAVRTPLRQSVVDGAWVAWEEASFPATMMVQRKILDEVFWMQVDALVQTLRPLHSLIRLVDMEGSTMGLLYHFWLRTRSLMHQNSCLAQDRFAIFLFLFIA